VFQFAFSFDFGSFTLHYIASVEEHVNCVLWLAELNPYEQWEEDLPHLTGKLQDTNSISYRRQIFKECFGE
jgi:hypothetical protein